MIKKASAVVGNISYNLAFLFTQQFYIFFKSDAEKSAFRNFARSSDIKVAIVPSVIRWNRVSEIEMRILKTVLSEATASALISIFPYLGLQNSSLSIRIMKSSNGFSSTQCRLFEPALEI